MAEEELILIGDRVLVEPEEGDDRTESGLYLPQGVKEKEKVHIGKIIKTGPGYPVPDASGLEQEAWLEPKRQDKYFPLQAKVGDSCIFLRDQGIEIQFKRKKYIVVPHSAILVIMRKKNQA